MNKTIILIFLGLLVLFIVGYSMYSKSGMPSTKTPNGSANMTGDATPNSSDILRLKGKGLTSLPQYIPNMINLVELDISNNNLTGALPSQIESLRNLKRLNASNNQMTGIPAQIGQLTKLEELDFSNNMITGLPNEIKNLKNLKTFNLTGNNYSKMDLAQIKLALPNLKVIGE